jgi:hypothetical protein
LPSQSAAPYYSDILSLTVLPQLYPDGPLPGRLWKVLLGISTGLIAIAALRNAHDFPTIDDQVE